MKSNYPYFQIISDILKNYKIIYFQSQLTNPHFIIDYDVRFVQINVNSREKNQKI